MTHDSIHDAIRRIARRPARRGCARPAVAAQTIQINGAGATFPYPIYSKWFSEYNKLHPNVQINYQSIGSGGGIRQLTNQTVFFGATDGPMTDGPAAGGAGQDPPLPDGARRRRAGLQHPGRRRRAEVHRPGARRHLPRQDHEVERPGDRDAEPGREAARPPTSPSCTARTAPARPTSGWTTSSKVSPEWKQKVGVATVGQLAGRRRRQGQRGRRRASSSRRRARSATSS